MGSSKTRSFSPARKLRSDPGFPRSVYTNEVFFQRHSVISKLRNLGQTGYGLCILFFNFDFYLMIFAILGFTDVIAKDIIRAIQCLNIIHDIFIFVH
jgi:hypothetical protein